jgi:ferredoxin-NADP reductase
MSTVRVADAQTVGDRTVALELETPADFEAYPGQFIVIRAQIDGEEETGYYTISSPTVEGTFEITVSYHPDGALGPELAAHERGDTVEIDGPFGDVTYHGDADILALAEGPGIGPAIAMAELGVQNDRDVTILFRGASPPHRDRLEAVDDSGGSVILVEAIDDADLRGERLDEREAFVFGFEGFTEDAVERLESLGFDADRLHVESFGPKG